MSVACKLLSLHIFAELMNEDVEKKGRVGDSKVGVHSP